MQHGVHRRIDLANQMFKAMNKRCGDGARRKLTEKVCRTLQC